MRATRLVSLLLLLQLRGQLTASDLAEHFGVSVRTIHRDVEALGAAGVPVEAVRGPAGGYRLSGGYRTKLTGLTADEAEALFVAPAPAAELGLGGVLANARLKVLAALPPELQEPAARSTRSAWCSKAAPGTSSRGAASGCASTAFRVSLRCGSARTGSTDPMASTWRRTG